MWIVVWKQLTMSLFLTFLNHENSSTGQVSYGSVLVAFGKQCCRKFVSQVIDVECHAVVYIGTPQSLRCEWLLGTQGPKLLNIKICCESLPNDLPSERILCSRSVLRDLGVSALLTIVVGPIVETRGDPGMLSTPLVSRGATKH